MIDLTIVKALLRHERKNMQHTRRKADTRVQGVVDARDLALCKDYLERRYGTRLGSNYSLIREIVVECALLAKTRGSLPIDHTHEAMAILEGGGVWNQHQRGRSLLENLQQDTREEEESPREWEERPAQSTNPYMDRTVQAEAVRQLHEDDRLDSQKMREEDRREKEEARKNRKTSITAGGYEVIEDHEEKKSLPPEYLEWQEAYQEAMQEHQRTRPVGGTAKEGKAWEAEGDTLNHEYIETRRRFGLPI